jgi:hypothetical protein
MSGLEHGQLLSYVAGTAKTEAAHHLGAQVRNNVSVEIRRNQNVVVERVLQQPHDERVDIGFIHGNTWKVAGNLFGSLQKQTVGARTTFALCTTVTFFRPNLRANSKAARTIRSNLRGY